MAMFVSTLYPQTNPNERWMPVVGHEGVYEVSDLGRVKRVAPGQGTHVGRILKPVIDRKGYEVVRLSGERQRVHRVVAAAFFGKSDMMVRHLDGNPMNNVPSNLRYGTPLENSADRIAHGRHRRNGRLEQTHCRHGHEYTPDNTIIRRQVGKRPYRGCRECRRVMKANVRIRKREHASQG